MVAVPAIRPPCHQNHIGAMIPNRINTHLRRALVGQAKLFAGGGVGAVQHPLGTAQTHLVQQTHHNGVERACRAQG